MKTVWKEDEKQKIISIYPNYISCEEFQKNEMPYRTVNQIYKKASRMNMNRGKRWETVKTYQDVSKEDLAYFAGILDGEGYICSQPERGIRIEVVNTFPELIYWLQATFGGSIYNRLPSKPNHKEQYSWILSRKENVMALLSLVRHLLIIKKQKTEYLFDQYGFKEVINE